MKTKKRLFASLLALVMMLTLNVTAFAQGFSDQTTVTVTKKYVAANEGTTSPAETFTLVQVGDGRVVDGEAETAPALATITGAAFAEGDASKTGSEKEITINLPTYDRVGIYEYTLQETAGTTAGVTYYSDPITLVVTVIQGSDGKIRVAGVHTESEGGEKSDTFVNTYSAGTLSVTKTVAGNLGDKDKYFKFTVTLTGEEGKTYASSYSVSGGSYKSNPESVTVGAPAEFYLKDGETLSISNLPYGVDYTVTEDNYSDYTTDKSGDTGTINSASQTASFTNTKEGEIDTGVYLDNLPYIIIFAGVLAAAAVVVIRRRRTED